MEVPALGRIAGGEICRLRILKGGCALAREAAPAMRGSRAIASGTAPRLTCINVAPCGSRYRPFVGELMNIPKFERFFRRAAGLNIDKEDLRRYDEFVHQKTYDMLLRGEANAKANGRDVIQPSDLPITKGLQESIHTYRRIDDEELHLASILGQLTKLPQLDLVYSEETTAKLPDIVGGLSYALARSFKILYPDLKNPQTQHWRSVYELFNLLL
jgi:Domain of unknown function (DUF1931)